MEATTDSYVEVTTNINLAALDEPPPSVFNTFILPILFFLVFIVGLIGNSMVIHIMKQLYTSSRISDLFLINLAVADALFICTLPFHAVQYAMSNQWVFGKEMCKIISWSGLITAYATVFFMSIMSLDRFGAVVLNEQTKKLRTTKWAFIITAVLWCISIMMASPALYFRNVISASEEQTYPEYCKWCFDDRKHGHEAWYLIQTGFRLIGGFLLPLFIITCCYIAIIIFLKKRKSQKRNLRKKQNKITWTITVVIIVFACCWLPNQISAAIYTAQAFGLMPSPESPNEIQDTIHLAATALIWSHSCVNPFLYAFMREDVKNKMMHILAKFKLFPCLKSASRTERSNNQNSQRLLTKRSDEGENSAPTNSYVMYCTRSKQTSSWKTKSKTLITGLSIERKTSLTTKKKEAEAPLAMNTPESPNKNHE